MSSVRAAEEDAKEGAEATASEAPPRPVKLMRVDEATDRVERTFYGQVVAPQTVDLAFQVGGRLESLPIREGQSIAEGDLVARLDLDPFERGLERARVELSQAERNAERTDRLSRSNTVSAVEAEDAQSALDLARLAFNDARQALDDATLHAPFDAIVSARHVSNYSTLAAGTAVARLLDLSELWINVDVPEVLFRRQSADSADQLSFSARFPGNDRRYPLEFREYNAETESLGQTYEVTLGMAPPDDMRVLPGASAMVTVGIERPGSIITLPATALVGDDDHELTVMVFEPDAATDNDVSDVGTVRQQRVPAEALPGGTEFRVEGLEAGVEVVASGGGLLRDGQRVRRFTGYSE